MTDGLTFISYSRREFYFTESLVYSLHRQGVPTWFDVQRLQPGHDWERGIDQGLQSCTSLTLIASRASLSSPYVRAEWQSALTAHKPMYVVIFEAVDLPPELAESSIFDFRSGFDRQLRSLAQAIRSGVAHRDALPRPNLLRLPARLPLQVGLVSGALLGIVILLLALAALMLSELAQRRILTSDLRDASFAIVSAGLLWAWLTGFAANAWWSFMRRRFKYGDLRMLLVAAPIVLWFVFRNLSGLTDFLAHGGSLALSMGSPPQYFVDEFLPGFFLVSALSWIGFRAMSRSSDVLRWLSTGEAPQSLRARLSMPIAPGEAYSKSVSAKTYRLHYEPADAGIADGMQSAMSAYAHRPQHDPDEAADCHIFVLTNNTSRSWLDQWVRASAGRLVSVAATSLRLPADSSAIHRYQWVDYRQRLPGQLRDMAQSLLHDHPFEAQAYSDVVPESLEKLVVPSGVSLFANTLRLVAALNVAGGVFAILAALQGIQGAALDVRAVSGVFIGAALFWLAGRLVNRDISRTLFLVAAAAAWATMVWSGLAAQIRLLYPAYTVGPINLYQVIWFVGPVVGLYLHFTSIRDWLPAIRAGRPLRDDSLAIPAQAQVWRAHVLFVVFAVAVLFSRIGEF